MTCPSFTEELLKACSSILNHAQTCLSKVKVLTKINNEQSLVDNGTALTEDTDFEELYIFPPSDEVNQLLIEVSNEIQIIIGKLRSFPIYEEMVFNYLLDFLYVFHFIDNQFTKPFSTVNLPEFVNEFAAFAESIQACQSARNGNLNVVEKFLSSYPSHRDRPLLGGYTLLYTASTGNHLEIVKYLIERANCTVNAQNQNDAPANCDTPLHGAARSEYVDIIRYLLQKGADCYLKNSKEETPTMIATRNPAVRKIFCDHLVIEYNQQESSQCCLPIKTIDDEISRLNNDVSQIKYDCLWEFQPSSHQSWQTFSPEESIILNKSFRETPGLNINVNIDNQNYTISTVAFLKSSNVEKESEQQAWIRCRGSGAYNFDIVPTWQFKIKQHHSICSDKNKLEEFNILKLPLIFDIDQPDLRLNIWYYADEFINASIDHAMNLRLRYLTMNTRFLGSITFNLESFSFENANETILGDIRWVPKFVNIDLKMKRIMLIDNFQDVRQYHQCLEPLRNKHLKELIIINTNEVEDVDMSNDNNDTFPTNLTTFDASDCTTYNTLHDQSGMSIEIPPLELDEDATISMKDYDPNIDNQVKDNHAAVLDTLRSTIREKQENLNKLNATARICEQKIQEEKQKLDETERKKAPHSVQDELIRKLCDGDNRFSDEEFISLKNEYQKQQDLLKKSMKELNAIKHQCIMLERNLNSERERIQKYEKLHQEENQANIELIKIQHDMPVHESVQLSIPIVETYLKKINFVGKTESHENKVKVYPDVNQSNTHFCAWILEGYNVHHIEMENICSRAQKLMRELSIQQQHYRKMLANHVQSFLNRNVRPVGQLQLKCSGKDWNIFIEILEKIIQENCAELEKKYNNHLVKTVKAVVNEMIQNTGGWSKRLQAKTNEFVKANDFLTSIEVLKYNALRQYIIEKEQKLLLNIQGNKRSIDAKKEHLRKLQELLESVSDYSGHERHHFSLLSSLINRIHIIIYCFRLQLPLFESSVELLRNICQNTVISISTATGSGKSTLLPALLVADGYDKVFVTQPRRLPCTLLSDRVNKSMESSNLSGWKVSGAHSKNAPYTPILYITDGLLKEFLLYRPDRLVHQVKTSKRGVIFFIDEVHERSVNIDLCLALLARFLQKNPSLHEKIKIIISSATLEPTVPQLFRPFKLYEAHIQISTLHHVKKHPYSSENLIELVSRLHQQIERGEQILCFLKSNSEVTQSIKLLKQLKGLSAFPLIQSQSSAEQERLIKKKQIFFSTTVAETSLTFPTLKYVIDTGLIHMPVYDPQNDSTELREIHAAESTIKQRQGRLGRTQDGEYFPLYSFEVTHKKFPEPQLCQTELSNIEFSLRRSPLRCTLNDLKQWLPNSPCQQAIDAAMNRLCQFDILDMQKNFTSDGFSISRLPDFGSIEMSRAVWAALKWFKCGRDLLRLAAILGVLNTSAFLPSLPRKFKKPEGDFMTLLNVMDTLLAQRLIQPPHLFNIESACQEIGLSFIKHYLKRALTRYISFERYFRHPSEYYNAAQCTSDGYWEPVARALLEGYSNNVYLSQIEIQGKTNHFLRYTATKTTEKQKTAVLDLTSTLRRSMNSNNPVSLIVARDIRMSTDVRARSIVSFLGVIQPEWFDRALERTIKMHAAEVKLFNEKIKISPEFMTKCSKIHHHIDINNQLTLSGSAGHVLLSELFIRTSFLTKHETFLLAKTENNTSMKTKVTDLTQELQIFLPMKWRWRNEKQVKLIFQKEIDNLKVVIKAREDDYELVRKELDSFVGWLQPCVAVHPDLGILPRRFIDPDTKTTATDIEKRINHITNISMTSVDHWPRLRGPAATRETRMEVVAWIAVCLFYCKLEGGFVRDWIVANQTSRPPSTVSPKQWVQIVNKVPAIDKACIPSDLDCHLPKDHYFDIDRFLDEMHKYDIKTKVYREHWRYILLFDEDTLTGPFTMDLIEPHVALTHDRIDFDVNNLYIKRDFCTELGQRVDLRHQPFSIDLEQTVIKIKRKEFSVLRSMDTRMQERRDKMISRGWKQVGTDQNYVPPPRNSKYTTTMLPKTDSLYQTIEQKMQQIRNVNIKRMEQICNPDLEKMYHSSRQIIQDQCLQHDANQQYLFHGTSAENVTSIMSMGFDDRYFSAGGLYGHGAYFADNPLKSHQYKGKPDEKGYYKMFYTQVTLGTVSDVSEITRNLLSAPPNFHSVRGLADPSMVEYIVYRMSQALPYILITYQAP